MIGEIYVYRVPMNGLNIKEMVPPNCEEPGYTIYIDESLDDMHARAIYEHAIRHITNNDFHSGKDVQDIENKAHSA